MSNNNSKNKLKEYLDYDGLKIVIDSLNQSKWKRLEADENTEKN